MNNSTKKSELNPVSTTFRLLLALAIALDNRFTFVRFKHVGDSARSALSHKNILSPRNIS